MQDYRDKKTLENILYGLVLMAVGGVIYFVVTLLF